MLKAGKALKVSIYVSEGSRHHGIPVSSSILDFLFYKGVSGATAVKGIAGFGNTFIEKEVKNARRHRDSVMPRPLADID